MEPREFGGLVVFSASHPSAAVDRFGFPLDHPYVEQCLLPVLGPSSVMVLHRMPTLWTVAHPFDTTFQELACALGLRPGRLSETFDRLAKYGFANRPSHGELDVYTRCAPLTSRMQGRLPGWLQAAHSRMLDEHLASRVPHLAQATDIAGTQGPAVAPGAPSASPPPTELLRQKPPRALER